MRIAPARATTPSVEEPEGGGGWKTRRSIDGEAATREDFLTAVGASAWGGSKVLVGADADENTVPEVDEEWATRRDKDGRAITREEFLEKVGLSAWGGSAPHVGAGVEAEEETAERAEVAAVEDLLEREERSVSYRSSMLSALEGTRLKVIVTAGPSLTKLDLSHNSLTSLPDVIFGSTAHLRHIALNENRFVAIPALVPRCVALERLEMSGNALDWRSLRPLGKLPFLRWLEIEDAGLADLPREIGGLTALETLLLASNKFGSRALGQCPRAIVGIGSALRFLRLDDNPELAKVNVKTLSGLTRLSICGTGLKALPTGIKGLVNLTDLALARNRIGKIAFGDIRTLVRLERVDLSYNSELALRKTETLIQLVGMWPALRSLHLDCQQIGRLAGADAKRLGAHMKKKGARVVADVKDAPLMRKAADAAALQIEVGAETTLPGEVWNALAYWPRRLQLLVNNNFVTSFPPAEVVEVTEPRAGGKKSGGLFAKRSKVKGAVLTPLVRDVRICNVPLATLAPSIGTLLSLERLIVTQHNLRELPSELGALSALVALELSHGSLRRVPKSIGRLGALTKLYLAGNEIRSLPDSICELSALRVLKVGHNKVRALPERIGDLRRLERLDLDANRLIALPDSIGELCCLRELLLGFNLLTALPESIGAIGASLRRLILDHNKLVCLPRSACALVNAELHLEGNPDLGVRPPFVEEAPNDDVASDALGSILGFRKAAPKKVVKVRDAPSDIVGDVVSSLLDNGSAVFMQRPLTELFAQDLSNMGVKAKLTVIPQYVWSLSYSLRELLFSSNALAELPRAIGKCVRLRKLWLNSNELEALPIEIEDCVCLEELSLWNNPVHSLPEQMGSMKTMKLMCLDPMVIISPHDAVQRAIGGLKVHGCVIK